MGLAMRCARCRYDLRATARDSACPECGLAVRSSVIPILALASDDPPGARSARIAFEIGVLAAWSVVAGGPAAGILAATAARHAGFLESGHRAAGWDILLLAAVATAGTAGLAAGALLLRRAGRTLDVAAIPGVVASVARASLYAAAAVVVFLSVALVEAIRRGDGLLGPVASSVWLVLLPLRSYLLVNVFGAARAFGVPRFQRLAHPAVLHGLAVALGLAWLAVALAAAIRLFVRPLGGGAGPLGVSGDAIAGAAVALCAVDLLLALATINAVTVAQHAVRSDRATA